MINEVYNSRIIELAGNIPRLGRLDHPDATATAHSKLCGSTVTVDLKMAGDEVTDFAHDVKACALGQASSSIMARHVVGAKADELRALYAGKGVTADKEVVAYCRIGERSSHTWYVLHYLLGYPKVRNYDGSWTEWGSLIGAPIEK